MAEPALPETTAAAKPAPRQPETLSIHLVEPIERESGPIATLTLRKPKSGELRGLKVGELYNGDVTSVLAVLPRICDPFITDKEAGELSTEDLGEVAGAITGFFHTPAVKAAIAKMSGG